MFIGANQDMGRNRERGGLWVVNNLIYPDYTAAMEEGREELKSLLMKVKEESEKTGLKLNTQKIEIMSSGPISFCQIMGRSRNSDRFYFLGVQNHCG